MYHGLIIAALVSAAIAVVLCSTLAFALRDFSRSNLLEQFRRRNRETYYQRTVDLAEELYFLTAIIRLLLNTTMFVCVLGLFHDLDLNRWFQYIYAFLVTSAIAIFASVIIPLAIARYVGELIIAFFARPLYAMHVVLLPAVRIMNAVDILVGRAAGPQSEEQEQREIEDQILTAVEEGEKEGLVDEQEREMIESVIEFRDATAGEVMTARPDIVALRADTPLSQVKAAIETHGLSRIPVYQDSLDQIIGLIYARDLLKYIDKSPTSFEIRKIMRPAFFVPETKPLGDLLRDFRQMKIHMAIVLDEYGGTAGLVTIEDVLEQLVGEISDEHEPQEPAMLHKVDESAWEIDARMTISEINRAIAVNLPEEDDIHTLGGYVATVIGRIPERGATLDLPGMKLTVIAAEPQRINRIRLELLPPVETATGEVQ